jgi:hypothetical protein
MPTPEEVIAQLRAQVEGAPVANVQAGLASLFEATLTSTRFKAQEAWILIEQLSGSVLRLLTVAEAAEQIHGVAEWRKRHAQEPGVVYEANADVARLADALDAFCAAVRGEQERE